MSHGLLTSTSWKSFSAGIVSASIAWWIGVRITGAGAPSSSKLSRRQSISSDNEEVGSSQVEVKDDDTVVGDGRIGEGLSTYQLIHSHLIQLALSSSSQASPVIKSLWDLIRKSSIGDFPAEKKMRWAWESLRKNNQKSSQDRESSYPLSSSIVDESDVIHERLVRNDTESKKYLSSPSSAASKKTGLCIGNIYGLDVGGSLAKLVYFEKKDDNLNKSHTSPERGTSRTFNEINQNGSIGTRSQSVSNDLDKLGSSDHPQHKLSESNRSTPTPTPQRKLKLDDQYLIHKRKRSISMGDLSTLSAKRAQALDSFYSLARKLDIYETGVKEKNLSFYSKSLGGEFHFIQFESRHMNLAMDLIRSYKLHVNIVKMGATGGGAHKYADKWEKILGIKMSKQDELDSLVAGMQFLLEDNIIGECYALTNDYGNAIGDTESSISKPSSLENRQKVPSCNEQVEKSIEDYKSKGNMKREKKSDLRWWSKKVQRQVVTSDYPYLVVMIGTGVSVLRVDGSRKHERISGSTIGGGTYWGLCRLLTDVEDFESALGLAERGDPSKVDMMVGDIYGENSDALDKLGLTPDIVASSFGKLVAKQDPAKGLKQEDLARALLLMVTNNIGQVAYLNAQLHGTKRIFFVGNFLRENTLSQRRLAYAINYWSRGKMEALFLEHEGYFGALGAFLLNQESYSNDDSDLNDQC